MLTEGGRELNKGELCSYNRGEQIPAVGSILVSQYFKYFKCYRATPWGVAVLKHFLLQHGGVGEEEKAHPPWYKIKKYFLSVESLKCVLPVRYTVNIIVFPNW